MGANREGVYAGRTELIHHDLVGALTEYSVDEIFGLDKCPKITEG